MQDSTWTVAARAPGRPTQLRDTERLLVARAQNHDVNAVGELYARHREAITRYFLRIVGNRYDADDLAAETFVKVFQAIEHFRPQGLPFSSWVYRIAHNVAMDHFRAADRAQRVREIRPVASLANASAEDEALAALAHRGILATLHKLPACQRDVLVLLFVHALSNRETARILGKNEGSVKASRYRGLKALEASAAGVSTAAHAVPRRAAM